MIWGFVFVLFGLLTLGWGFNTFNDPTCASARISIKYRDMDIICYPTGSSPDGPIPGNVLAFGIMAASLLFFAIGVFSISESKNRKIEKKKSHDFGLEILGSVKGQSRAVHTFSGAEGNLLWSTEKFIFLSDEPSAKVLATLGPIGFSEIERPNFRMSVFSNKGYLLEFAGTTLAFTSESGKIKDLKKEIDRFKNANPA